MRFIFLSLLIGALASNFSSQLDALDSQLAQKGPDLTLLQSYELLLSAMILSPEKQNKLMSRAYYKKGLIDMFLGKETIAIADFQSCLEQDSTMSLAKIRLAKLYLEHGRYNDLDELATDASLKKNLEFQNIYQQKESALGSMKKSEKLSSEEKYMDCISSISDAIVISPRSPALYKTRIDCSVKAAIKGQKQVSSGDQHIPSDSRELVASHLIPDYLMLEQLSPLVVENYVNTANLYFFGLDEPENAAKHVRKGLHYDMDDKRLKQSSLFFKRNEVLLALVKHFKEFDLWVFDEEDINVKPLEKKDFAKAIQLLFHEKPNIPQRDINNVFKGKSFANNFEFLMYLIDEFNGQLTGEAHSSWKSLFGKKAKSHLINGLLLDLNKMACESYLVEKNVKEAKKYCENVVRLERQNHGDQNYETTFLPAKALEIQSYIKAKDLDKLKPLYENERIKTHELFKKTFERIEKMIAKEQQQRHQQQQQYQQRQQQQWQQQQQYQQRQQQPRTPKNDYYKTLGVSKDASSRDIKTAYRNLVKKYHPDKYKGDDAEEKITEVNKAYEVLGDEEARKRYDEMGDDPNDAEQPRGGQGAPFQGDIFQGNPFFGSNQFHFDFGGNQHFQYGGSGGGPRNPFGGGKKRSKKKGKKRKN